MWATPRYEILYIKSASSLMRVRRRRLCAKGRTPATKHSSLIVYSEASIRHSGTYLRRTHSSSAQLEIPMQQIPSLRNEGATCGPWRMSLCSQKKHMHQKRLAILQPRYAHPNANALSSAHRPMTMIPSSLILTLPLLIIIQTLHSLLDEWRSLQDILA